MMNLVGDLAPNFKSTITLTIVRNQTIMANVRNMTWEVFYVESQDSRRILLQFNGLWKEMDEIYHLLARHYGLSDCALWILYILRESEDIHTQRKICEQLSLSKQTVNSALKKLEVDGYIKLEALAGSQKNKQVLLTDAGLRFAEQTVDHILIMETNAFESFPIEERVVFLRLLKKYIIQLQNEAEKILKSKYS